VLPDDLTGKLSPSACPVPSEQLPLNEYQELRDSWFFRWVTLSLASYVRKLFWVGVWSGIVMGPIAAASFPATRYPVRFFLTSMAGTIAFLLLVLIRLYLGWAYVSSRLIDPNVVYEESGWYDGQVWMKPEAMLARDHLVATYQIQPLLRRIRKTFGVLALILLGGAIAWSVL
jgi:hypothetical protein